MEYLCSSCLLMESEFIALVPLFSWMMLLAFLNLKLRLGKFSASWIFDFVIPGLTTSSLFRCE